MGRGEKAQGWTTRELLDMRATLIRAAKGCGLGPEDAEDVAQEKLPKLLGRLKELSPANRDAYVHTTGRNAAYDHLRSIAATGAREEERRVDESGVFKLRDLDQRADRGEDPEHQLMRRQEAAAVRALVGNAPSEHREILTEVFLEEREVPTLVSLELEKRLACRVDALTQAELDAERMRSRDTVYKRLQRARDWFRDSYRDWLDRRSA